MLRSAHLFLLIFLLKCGIATAYIRLDYSPFFLYSNYNATPANGLYSRLDFRYSHYLGASASWTLTRHTSMSAGVGLTRVNFQKEIQGVFPETNSYGLVAIAQRNEYWTFPVSFCYSLAGRSSGNSGIRLSYVPCVLGGTRAETSLLGGAAQSSAAVYRDDSQPFRHALLLHVVNLARVGGSGVFFGLDPYVSIGSGFFKSDGVKINTMSFGLSVNVQFQLPQISFERSHDPVRERKKEAMKKKQQEIQQQLNNKPKH